MSKKILEIVAGPNGSGKSTFAESFFLRMKQSPVFMNPDILAAGLSPMDFNKGSVQAGRLLIQEVKTKIKNGESFSFESTLSGKTWSTFIKNAKQNGYQIHIYFLFLNEIKNNIARIKKRVRMGGHNIETDTVIRRHPRCFENFWNLYRPLCDQWYVFNNSGKTPRLLMDKKKFEELNESDKNFFIRNFLSVNTRGINGSR